MVRRFRTRNQGDSGQKGRPINRRTGKINCRAKGILYARVLERVPVPLRMRFAANWPMPMKSWTPEVVRPRIPTGQISAAKEEGIVKKQPSERPLMSCGGQQDVLE